MAIVNLSAPWVEHYRKLWAFFRNDPEVAVVFDGNEMSVKLYVDDMEKAEALSHVIACEKKFGNVTLTIEVIPGNDVKMLHGDKPDRRFCSNEEIWGVLALSNNAIDDVVQEIGIGGMRYIYVMCRAVVVQYFNDDTGDLNGMASTLYEDIARDIFTEATGVFFCTSPVLKINGGSGCGSCSMR